MRVLWFCNTPAAGDEYISSNGTGGWLKSLDKAIQEDVDLHVAFYDRRYPAEFTVGKTTYHQIAPQDKLSLIKRRIQLRLGNNPDLPRYLDVINRVQPDLIHIHGTEKPWIHLAGHTDIPVLLSIQAILTVMNHKYYSGIGKDELPFGNSYGSSYKGFVKEGCVERNNLKFVNYVLGRTEWDKRCYSILAPHARYYVSNEILRDGFYTNKWTEPDREDRKIIIHTTTGGLLFKGLETLCEAAYELERIGVIFEWRVAGVNENSELNKIVKKKLGSRYPTRSLKFMGSLNEGDLIASMLESHIFVYPTHQDNSSNALCEAMILGMPCVSTFAGGSGTMLRDGDTGIMVQDGDPWAMAGAILELAQDKEKASKYAFAAREVAQRRHNKQTIVDNLERVYQEVLSDSKRK